MKCIPEYDLSFQPASNKVFLLAKLHVEPKSNKVRGNRELVSFVNFNRPTLLINKFNISGVYFQYITLNFVELNDKIIRQKNT